MAFHHGPRAALLCKPPGRVFEAGEELMHWSEQRFTDAITDPHTIQEDCLLSRLMHAKSANGDELSHSYIAAELYDNLNAAQVTVAVTLTYIIYRLSCNNVWQSKIRSELRMLLGSSNGAPSLGEISNAPLLDAFIREVHRLHPGIGGHAERVVPAGGKVYNGIFISGGVSLCFLHLTGSSNPAVLS